MTAMALVLGALLSAGAPKAHTATLVNLGEDLRVTEIRPGFWLHVSVGPDGIEANGLLASLGDGALLVDTPWTAGQTRRLLDWAAGRGMPVVQAIGTHSHGDCLGGRVALEEAGVPIGALDLTVEIMRGRGETALPGVLLRAEEVVRRDPRGFEVVYPGPGHTRDNIVVWFPEARLLFGGCLIKSEDTRHMGYVGEADLGAWPATLAAVRERFGDDLTIVPGHGRPGGPGCIRNTLRLLREAVQRP